MKRLFFVNLLLGFIYIGCKGKGSEQPSEKIDSTTFFETSVIIKKDISEVDSTAFYIYKIEIVNGSKDSTSINKADFYRLAANFLKPNITSEELKHQYKESIFEDQLDDQYAGEWNKRGGFGISDIIFEQLSGEVNTGAGQITLSNGTKSQTINIRQTGQIDW